MFRSTDGGASWLQADVTSPAMNVYCLAVDPTHSNVVYAAGYNTGVHKSTDGGVTWNPANTGMGSVTIRDLAMTPGTPSVLYAAAQSKVFKSTDGGATWSALATGLDPGRYHPAVAIDPTSPARLFLGSDGAGVFRSTDGGSSWVQPVNGMTSSRVLSLLSTGSGGRLLAGVWDGGLFSSSDGGVTWSRLATIPTAVDVSALLASPGQPQNLYAAAGTWLYTSSDGGATWAVSGNRPSGHSIEAIAVLPSTPATVYVAASSNVFRSTDGGASWTDSSVGLPGKGVNSLAIHPTQDQTLVAGTWGGGIYRSTDGGASWSVASGATNNYVNALIYNAASPGTAWAGTTAGTFTSADGGATWTKSSSGITTGVNAVVLDPGDPNILYAGTGGGVYKSSDGGGHWVAISANEFNRNVDALALDGNDPATIHAGSEGDGVWSLTQPPCPVPTGLANNTAADVDACGKTGVVVGWSDPTDWQDDGSGTRAFTVLRNGSALASGLSASTHSYTDTSGTAGTSYLYAVRAVNGCGAGTTTSGITVTDQAAVPQITAQPLSSTVAAGGSVTLSVTASAATSYQWYRGSSGDTASPILGATAASYTTPPMAATTSFWVRASGGCGSVDSAAATVTVTPSTAAHQYLVPVVAHWPGAGGTAWRSDLSLINPGSAAATVTLLYVSVTDGWSSGYQAQLAPGATVMYRDLLVTPLGLAATGKTKGALLVASDSSLVAFSRTYNQTSEGTFGQLMPALKVTDTFTKGTVGRLPHLTQNGAYRTHVGFANLSPSGSCSVKVRLYGADGAQLGNSVTLTAGAGLAVQRDYIFSAAGVSADQEVAYATVEVVTDGCKAWAYASVVDAVSGDPTTVPVQLE